MDQQYLNESSGIHVTIYVAYPNYSAGRKGNWAGTSETQSTFISHGDEVRESNGNQEPNQNETSLTKSRR